MKKLIIKADLGKTSTKENRNKDNKRLVVVGKNF
jgi:hypothetical protein